MHKWFVYDEFDKASIAAADFLAKQIEACVKQKGICHIVLPGGGSPAHCLTYLAKKDLPWSQVNWYLGDERCYPVGHVERNDVMLDRNLWSHILKPNVHRIPAELGAEQAAKVYRKVIKPVEVFDVVFLGMGEDGHTASLFPDNDALQDTRSVVPVYEAPKAPDERVSLSISTIKKAKCRMVLTAGAGKAKILAHIRGGAPLPINMIGDINWYVDEAAMSTGI